MVSLEQRNICIIGIGNEYRGDDAAGLLVARKLTNKIAQHITLIEMDGETTKLMDTMKGRYAAILVDAMQSGSKVGTVSRFDAGTQPLPMSLLRCSTHVAGVSSAIELARALGWLPQYVVVYGIEANCFEPGSGLSPEVTTALGEAVERILDEIKTLLKS